MDTKRKRYTEEQGNSSLNEHEAGASVPDLLRRHRVAENTIGRWRSKFGGMIEFKGAELVVFEFR